MKLGLEREVKAGYGGLGIANNKSRDFMERAQDLKLDDPEIKSQLCHLLPVWPRATDFSVLSFFICKVGCCKGVTKFQKGVGA